MRWKELGYAARLRSRAGQNGLLGSRPRSKDHGSVRYSSTQRIVESPYTYFYIFHLYTKCRHPSLRICHDVRATRP
ncbi:hypothetical protein CBM2629_B40278 [Cupriavidus taiwanensis]|nr:hypothetical protein CBM2629_B40278 [Cupriavidus taiwanensis]